MTEACWNGVFAGNGLRYVWDCSKKCPRGRDGDDDDDVKREWYDGGKGASKSRQQQVRLARESVVLLQATWRRGFQVPVSVCADAMKPSRVTVYQLPLDGSQACSADDCLCPFTPRSRLKRPEKRLVG